MPAKTNGNKLSVKRRSRTAVESDHFYVRNLSEGAVHEITRRAELMHQAPGSFLRHVVELLTSNSELFDQLLAGPNLQGSIARLEKGIENLYWAQLAHDREAHGLANYYASALLAEYEPFHGLSQCGRYEASFSLADLGVSLMKRSILMRDPEMAIRSRRTVAFAISRLNEFRERDHQGIGWVATYNAACSYSLVAQSVIIEALLPQFPDRFPAEEDGFDSAMKSAWLTWIGTDWRKGVGGDSAKKVDKLCKRTFEQLRQLIPSPRRAPALILDPRFWIARAAIDSDLINLRADKHYNQELEKWKTQMSNAEKHCVDEFAFVESRIPKAVQDDAERILEEFNL